MVHLRGDRGYSLSAVGSNVKFCYKISLTGQVTKIIDLDFKTNTSRFREIRGLYFDESNTLFGFNAFDNTFGDRTQRVVINPVTGSVTPDGGLTVPAPAGSFASY